MLNLKILGVLRNSRRTRGFMFMKKEISLPAWPAFSPNSPTASIDAVTKHTTSLPVPVNRLIKTRQWRRFSSRSLLSSFFLLQSSRVHLRRRLFVSVTSGAQRLSFLSHQMITMKKRAFGRMSVSGGSWR